MLQKHPKPTYRKIIKRGAATLFIAEAVCFALSYAGWYRLNTNRDFRLYMYKNHSWILDGYYKFGEFVNPEKSPRQLDLAVWRQEGKI
ncbi:hypothetical protein B566_EDAN013873 [Ephemera danica]|nr:hypothetical protein B566_EDAN013873 [Ephemera danica]